MNHGTTVVGSATGISGDDGDGVVDSPMQTRETYEQTTTYGELDPPSPTMVTSTSHHSHPATTATISDEEPEEGEEELATADDLLEPPPIKPAPSKVNKKKKDKKTKKKKKEKQRASHVATTAEILDLLRRLGPDVDLTELTENLSPALKKQPKMTPKKSNTTKSIKKAKKKKAKQKKKKQEQEQIEASPLYYAQDASLISERTYSSEGATIATIQSGHATRMSGQFTGTTMECTTYHSSTCDDEDTDSSALGLGSSILSYRSDRSTTPASLRLSTPTPGQQRTLTPTEILEGAMLRGTSSGNDSAASASPSMGSNLLIVSEDEQSDAEFQMLLRTAEQDWHRYSQDDLAQHAQQAMMKKDDDSPPDGSVSASASSFSVGGASSFSVGAALRGVTRGMAGTSSENHSDSLDVTDGGDRSTFSSSRTTRRRPPPQIRVGSGPMRQNSIRGQESGESITSSSRFSESTSWDVADGTSSWSGRTRRRPPHQIMTVARMRQNSSRGHESEESLMTVARMRENSIHGQASEESPMSLARFRQNSMRGQESGDSLTSSSRITDATLGVTDGTFSSSRKTRRRPPPQIMTFSKNRQGRLHEREESSTTVRRIRLRGKEREESPITESIVQQESGEEETSPSRQDDEKEEEEEETDRKIDGNRRKPKSKSRAGSSRSPPRTIIGRPGVRPRPPTSPSSDDDSDSELRALHSRFASRRRQPSSARRVKDRDRRRSRPSRSEPKTVDKAASPMPGSLKSLSDWVQESTKKGEEPDLVVKQLVSQGMDESTASALVAEHLAAAGSPSGDVLRLGSTDGETSVAAVSTGSNGTYKSIANQLLRLTPAPESEWLVEGGSSGSGERAMMSTESVARSDGSRQVQAVSSDESDGTRVVDATPTSMKNMFQKSPYRRIVLTGVLVVIVAVTIGAAMGVLVRGGPPEEGATIPSTAPTFSPTGLPTFITDEIREAAVAISGEAVSTPGTPQHDAVGWLSTFDDELAGRGLSDVGFTQRYVMVLFYFSTNGRQWGPGWLDPQAHECDWDFDYIKCIDVDGERVVNELKLVEVGLRGTLPTEIGLLNQMIEFSVALNPQLTGSIPHDMCGENGLKRLSWLDLKGNSLTGPIPSSMGQCSSLRFISLNQNELNGTIPESMYDLTSLEKLDLSSNNLEGALMPDALSQFSLLTVLNLAMNQLTGTVPDLLWATNLTTVDLNWNLFSGRVPDFDTQLAGLETFSAAHNQLSGTLEFDSPGGKLEKLDLSFNKLEGTFPSLGDLNALLSLVHLDLSSNDFTGTIGTIGGNLESFLCADNRLTGTLHGVASDSLQHIDVRSNDFVGGIPGDVYSLTNLKTLMLSNNPDLGGPLDAELGDLTGIRHLHLRNCGLTGTLPTTLEGLDSCRKFDIGENKIEGPIPSEMGMWRSLQELHLQSNVFQMTIPTELGLLTDLRILNVANNSLTGSLPHDINWLGNLEELYTVGNSHLTGNISGPLCNQASNLSFENLGCGFICPCCTDTDFCEGSP